MTGPFPPASRYIDDSFLELREIAANQKNSCIKSRALLRTSVLCAAITIGIG